MLCERHLTIGSNYHSNSKWPIDRDARDAEVPDKRIKGPGRVARSWVDHLKRGGCSILRRGKESGMLGVAWHPIDVQCNGLPPLQCRNRATPTVTVMSSHFSHSKRHTHITPITYFRNSGSSYLHNSTSGCNCLGGHLEPFLSIVSLAMLRRSP